MSLRVALVVQYEAAELALSEGTSDVSSSLILICPFHHPQNNLSNSSGWSSSPSALSRAI